MGAVKTVQTNAFNPDRQDKEEQWPQKAPWNFQAGHNDNLFHSKVVKSRHRFHMEAMGLLFLGVFMASGSKS